MVAIAVSPGTLTTAGVDVGFGSGIDVEPPDSIITSGVPVGFTTTADVVVPTTTPDAVKARVLDENGTFIAHLPHAQGVRFLDEHNSAGGGSVDYRRYDDLEADHPTLWQAGNQVMVSVGSLDVARIILDSEPSYRVDDTGSRIDTWTGVLQLGVINSGMIEPEYGWRPEATDERSFDYGSNPAIGGWLVPSEWKTPVGKLVRKSWRWTYKKRHLPKGFPTKQASWIWYRNPDATSSANETCYFRSSFTLSQARRVKFWVCGDDTLEFQVDGEIRATTGPGGWKKATAFVLTLAAGTHYVAAKVTNTPGSTGNANRSGFLCAIGRVDGDGNVTRWLRRSNTTSWTVRRQRSGPPGWFPAQIALQLVSEQQARGCAGHAGITFGFSTTKDSRHAAWTARRDLGLQVETLGLDWMQQLVETGLMDVSMTPGLRLDLWRRRGTDRSRYIRLGQNGSRILDESAAQPPGIRNVLYARAKTGWVGKTAAGSVAAYGRRESGITLGSSRSAAQTDAALASMITDLAYPPQTFTVKISGASGWQPYKHFEVADWIGHKPAGASTWVRCRVMSIGLEVNPAGHPDWTLQLYED